MVYQILFLRKISPVHWSFDVYLLKDREPEASADMSSLNFSFKNFSVVALGRPSSYTAAAFS